MDDEEDEEEEDDEEEEEAGEDDATPPTQTHSPAAEENYIPDSPPISPVELKKELPKYLPALQVRSGFRRRSPGAGGAAVLRMHVFHSGLSQRRRVPVLESHRGGNLRCRVQGQGQKDRFVELQGVPLFVLAYVFKE